MKNHSFLLAFIFSCTYFISVAQKKPFTESFQKTYENYKEAVSSKKYKKASLILDSIITEDSKNNYWLIDKAELEAILDHPQKANQYLQTAYRNGYRNLSLIQSNVHLAKLKKTKAFNELIEKLHKELSSYKLAEGKQDLIIDIPPLLECYVIMLYLSNPEHPLINKKRNHFYFKRIDDYFETYKDHPMVQQIAQQYPGNKDIWINNLRAHHNLRTLYIYDDLDIDTIKRFPIEIDYSLAKTVRNFALASNFMQFYSENKEFYDAMTKVMRTNYSFGSHVISFFNENFKEKLNRFNIYFSPIYGGWQHGPTATIDKYTECFYFGGIMYTPTKQFYYPDVYLLFTFLTEFDHTTVNKITSTYRKDLETLKEKAQLLNTSGKVSYSGLESTLNEYITWAFALQFFYEYTPSEYEALKKDIVWNMENNRGFAKFGDFMLFYESYIKNRETYPFLRDFYPMIIQWVNDL